VLPVGLIIRIYHDALSPERQNIVIVLLFQSVRHLFLQTLCNRLSPALP